MPNQAEVIATIIQSLTTLPDRLGPSQKDSLWTKQLKEDIGTIGESHRWDVCASGFPHRYECEWLYDLTWYRNDSENHLADVGLVLESEWNPAPACIKYDFEKLLLAKALIKVMVFQGDDRDLAEKLELLERGIRTFRNRSAEETYILAGFNNSKFSFEFRQLNGA